MPLKVITDGQVVHRLSGSASVGSDKTVMLGYATIEQAGAILQDDEVSEEFLRLVKDGEVAGAEFYSSEDEAREADVPASPEAQQPQNNQDLNPGRESAPDGDGESESDTGADQGQDYKDDPSFDPDEHVVAEVVDYLKTASPEEVARVQEVESRGQGRQGIANYSAPASFED